MGKEILKIPIQGTNKNIVRVEKEGSDYHFIFFTGGRSPYKDTMLTKDQLKSLVYGLAEELG